MTRPGTIRRANVPASGPRPLPDECDDHTGWIAVDVSEEFGRAVAVLLRKGQRGALLLLLAKQSGIVAIALLAQIPARRLAAFVERRSLAFQNRCLQGGK